MRFAYRLRDARQARGLSADCRACGLLLSFARTRAFRTEAPDADIPLHAGIPLGAAMKLKQLQALRAVAETGSLQGAAGSLRDPARRQPRDHRSGVGTWRSAADADGARGIVDRVRRVHPETGAAHRPRGRAHLRRRRCRARRRRRQPVHRDHARVRHRGLPRRRDRVRRRAARRAAQHPGTAPRADRGRPPDGSLDIALYTEYGLLEDAAPHYRLESLYEIGSALAVSGGYAGPLDVSAEDLQAQRWMVLDAASDESSLMRVLFPSTAWRRLRACCAARPPMSTPIW